MSETSPSNPVSSKPSNELVPLSYNRMVYNDMHGTELQTHTDALTAEQATRINNNYDIHVYVGAHGQEDDGTNNKANLMELPTQKEYGQAAAVIDTMEPGDVLFLEGYGHDTQPKPPVTMPDILPGAQAERRNDPLSLQHMMGNVVLGALTNIQDIARRHASQELEAERAEYKLSVWDYARRRAHLRGIQTVLADHDAASAESLKALTGGKDLRELRADDSTPAERDLADRIHTQRGQAARNILKDTALANLPQAEMATQQGRKPKLVKMFGLVHKEGLRQAFDDLDLQAAMHTMEMSSPEERYQEQVDRLKAQAAEATSTFQGPQKARAPGDTTAASARHLERARLRKSPTHKNSFQASRLANKRNPPNTTSE